MESIAVQKKRPAFAVSEIALPILDKRGDVIGTSTLTTRHKQDAELFFLDLSKRQSFKVGVYLLGLGKRLMLRDTLDAS